MIKQLLREMNFPDVGRYNTRPILPRNVRRVAGVLNGGSEKP
jgi:hypothetical protein